MDLERKGKTLEEIFTSTTKEEILRNRDSTIRATTMETFRGIKEIQEIQENLEMVEIHPEGKELVRGIGCISVKGVLTITQGRITTEIWLHVACATS